MFFDELLKSLKQDQTFAPFTYQCIGFEAICVQGKFSIEFFSSIKIILGFKKEKLFIYGNNLELKNIDSTQILIVGKIFCTSSKEVNFG